MTDPALFETHHFISYFRVKTYVTASNQLGIQVQFLSASAPNILNFSTTRLVTSSYQTIGMVFVLIKSAELALNQVLRHLNFFSVNHNTPLSSSDNMNIPGIWAGSSFGGYQGRCTIGLQRLYFGGDGTINVTRSVIFLQNNNTFGPSVIN